MKIPHKWSLCSPSEEGYTKQSRERVDRYKRSAYGRIKKSELFGCGQEAGWLQ
jgi:hypothetical protein